MYECFHCGCKSVIWDTDFDFSDYGEYECFHCGCKSVIWDTDFDFSDYGEEGE